MLYVLRFMQGTPMDLRYKVSYACELYSALHAMYTNKAISVLRLLSADHKTPSLRQRLENDDGVLNSIKTAIMTAP